MSASGQWSDICTEALFSEMQTRSRAALDDAIAERGEDACGIMYIPTSRGADRTLGLGIHIGGAVAYPTGPASWLVVRPMPASPDGSGQCSGCLAAYRLSTSEVAALAAAVTSDV